MSEDPGADGMSPTVAFRDGQELGPLKVSARTVSLKDEGVRGSGQATNRRKLRAPKVHFLFKSHQIPSSGTRSDKLQRRPTAFHTHVSGRWQQAALGIELLGKRPGFPEEG
jgi:hypothetical protein